MGKTCFASLSIPLYPAVGYHHAICHAAQRTISSPTTPSAVVIFNEARLYDLPDRGDGVRMAQGVLQTCVGACYHQVSKAVLSKMFAFTSIAERFAGWQLRAEVIPNYIAAVFVCACICTHAFEIGQRILLCLPDFVIRLLFSPANSHRPIIFAVAK
jgi:hypothetical protein